MSKRRITLASLLLGIAAVMPALGQPAAAPKKSVLPSFDARDLAAAEETDAARQARDLVARRKAGIESFLAAEAAANPGTRIAPNRYGVPKLFLRDGKPLSAPSTGDPEQIAKAFLRAHAALFPFTASEVDNLRLLVNDATPSATFLSFNQTLDGIDVFEGQIKFTLSAAGEVVETAAGEVVPGVSVSTTPRLSPEEALRAAFAAIGARAPGVPSRTSEADGNSSSRTPRGSRLNPTIVELSIFPLTATSARLAYRILLDADEESYWEILIAADDGSLLYRHNLYVHAQGTVWTQSPLIGARQVVTFPPASNPFSDPWVPAAANGSGGTGWVTTGNNTDTYLDANGDDKPDSVTNTVMQTGRSYAANQDFTFPFGDGTVGQDPRNYQAASVANLFYFINLAHDYFYGLGFTEKAGNFQTNNYGRGGVGNDAVLAEAQNPNFVDNASFAPTPEGVPPHIRVGIFTMGTSSQTDDRDADYDGQVLMHESGHGLSNRLVGSLVSTSCLDQIQSGAMGEGWSDYWSISFFNNPVEGAYVTANTVSGVRRYSYEGYPYTYKDIGNQGYEVHNDGEIWAATLWDLRKSLGQAVTDQLVMNGLKSTPCNPSMTNARDAILAADVAANGGANQAVIWQIFAKHGMGHSALGVDGDEMTGTRYDAAYDLPAALNPAITSNPLTIAASLNSSYIYQIAATNPNGGVLNYSLTSGPAGMTVNSATGSVSWTTGFTGQRIQITVADGKGGQVVHGYFLPVLTPLNVGAPVTIAGSQGSAGFATFAVAANTQVLQVTLRGGTGDADLFVVGPDSNYYISANNGNNETLTIVNPLAGTWQIEVDGYLTYSGVALLAASVTPALLSANTTVSGLSGVLGSETLYRIAVSAGAPRLLVTTSGGSGDVDIFLRQGQPAACSFLTYEPCLYDWASDNSGNAESINIASPAAGDWYLDLSAYLAYSGVTLTTATAAPVLAIVTASPLPAGAVGSAYSQALSASGGTAPYTWSLTSGSLPAGLALSGGGTISGTPTAAGTSSFTVQVKDNASATATQTFSLTVGAAGSLLGTITTVAGGGIAGYSGDGGPATAAQLYHPDGVAVDGSGNLYIGDYANSRVRKVTPAGIITTVAGNGVAGFSGDGGLATAAQLNGPGRVAVDTSGNLYIGDWNNYRVRKVTPAGIISTVAGNGLATYSGDGGQATSTAVNVNGVAVDALGNLYIADSNNSRVRKVTPAGIISTVAGNGIGGYSGDGGQAASAEITFPTWVTVDGSGNLWISDTGNYRVRKVTPAGIISTVAGNGVITQLYPIGLALDGSGDLFIADYNNQRIQKVSSGGVLSIIAGTGVAGYSGDGGPATAAQLNNPAGVALDGSGNLYIADYLNNRVRMVWSAAGALMSVATPSPLPPGVTGAAYSLTLAATGGVPPYTWSVTSGALPPGLALSASGAITGVPTTLGAYSFTVQAKDSVSTTATATLALTIVTPGGALSIVTSSPLLSGFTNGAFYQTLLAAGGAPPYVWSLASGALPAGLALSAGGAISGTPTAAGTFNFTVQVGDSSSSTASKPFALTVANVPGSGAGSLSRVGILSQFAAAGGWDTAVWIMNNSAAAVPVRLIFRGDDGSQAFKTSTGTIVAVPLTVTQQGDTETVTVTTLDRVVNPYTTLVVAGGLGLGGNSAQGWVDVLASGTVSGFAVFRYAPGGLTAPPLPWTTAWFTPWEGTVPLQTPGSTTSLILPFDNTSGFSTGVAIGSFTGAPASITVSCYDNNGNALGSLQTLSLGANGHTAFMMGSQYPNTANTSGIVKFTGPSLMGLGLRASPYGTLTSVPAIQQ